MDAEKVPRLRPGAAPYYNCRVIENRHISSGCGSQTVPTRAIIPLPGSVTGYSSGLPRKCMRAGVRPGLQILRVCPWWTGRFDSDTLPPF